MGFHRIDFLLVEQLKDESVVDSLDKLTIKQPLNQDHIVVSQLDDDIISLEKGNVKYLELINSNGESTSFSAKDQNIKVEGELGTIHLYLSKQSAALSEYKNFIPNEDLNNGLIIYQQHTFSPNFADAFGIRFVDNQGNSIEGILLLSILDVTSQKTNERDLDDDLKTDIYDDFQTQTIANNSEILNPTEHSSGTSTVGSVLPNEEPDQSPPDKKKKIIDEVSQEEAAGETAIEDITTLDATAAVGVSNEGFSLPPYLTFGSFIVPISIPRNFEIGYRFDSIVEYIADIIEDDLILSNEPPPPECPEGIISIAINDVMVFENDGQATFEVKLDNPSSCDIKIFYSTEDGTAVSGGNVNVGTDDYVPKNDYIMISQGEMAAYIVIDINNDIVFEDDEYFIINLSSFQAECNCFSIEDSVGIGTIKNDDEPPALLNELFINEIGLQNATSPSVEDEEDSVGNHDDVSFIEIQNNFNDAVNFSDITGATIEIIDDDGNLSIVALDSLMNSGGGVVSGAIITGNGHLVVYEDGTWESYNNSSVFKSGYYTGFTFNGIPQNPLSSSENWDLASSTNKAIAVNLVQNGSSLDLFVANGVDTTSLTGVRDIADPSNLNGDGLIGSLTATPINQILVNSFRSLTEWSGHNNFDMASSAFMASQLLNGPSLDPNEPTDVPLIFVDNRQFNGKVGDQGGVLRLILNDNFNEEDWVPESSLDNEFTTFARVYDGFLLETKGQPGKVQTKDGYFIDSNREDDWTLTTTEGITIGNYNHLEEGKGKSLMLSDIDNPLDMNDNTNPRQEAGDIVVRDAFEGQTILDDSLDGDSADNNLLEGSFGPDFLFGDAGQDTLNGNQHNDFLFGGSQNDVLNGNSGADLLLDVEGSDTLNGGTGNDILVTNNIMLLGAEIGPVDDGLGDNLFGNEGDDILLGGLGNDILDGGSGNDVLYGWRGNNTYTGGADDDIFVISVDPSQDTSLHVITDYNFAEGDMILFTDVLVGVNTLSDLVLLDADVTVINNDGDATANDVQAILTFDGGSSTANLIIEDLSLIPANPIDTIAELDIAILTQYDTL